MNFVFNISCFLRVLCYFQHLKNKKFVYKKNVFDIDGILFEFFMNFLNIENKILNILFSIFHVFSRFMLFLILKKK